MPDVSSHIDMLGGAKFISVIDLAVVYHQIPIAEGEVENTIFVRTKGSKYPYYTRIFQRNMTLTFAIFR